MTIEREASLSTDGVYRWSLSRVWAKNRPAVTWLMLNPSTADHLTDDATIRRCTGFTQRWGYGGLHVVNIYPFRAIYPRELWEWTAWFDRRDWYARDAYRENLAVIEEAGEDAALRVAAFGAVSLSQAQHDAQEAMDVFGLYGPVHCIGKTKLGWPKHPLARGKHVVPRDQQPILYSDE